MPCASDPAAAARLLIRGEMPGPVMALRMQALMRRLRLRCGLPARPARASEANIDIRDLQGRRVLEVRAARPPLDLDLPAGTYHVSIDAGERRRLYTIVLEPGASFELRVHAPARELAT